MTNSNTSHTHKILLTTLTLLFLTGFSAALDGETISSDEPNIGAIAQHTYSFDVQDDASTDSIASEDLDSLTITTSNSEFSGTINPSDVTVNIGGDGTSYTGTGDATSLQITNSDSNTLEVDLYDDSSGSTTQEAVTDNENIEVIVNGVQNPDSVGDYNVDITATGGSSGTDSIPTLTYSTESVTVSGTVTDDSSTAIDGATVSFDNDNTYSATTDANGDYSVSVDDLGTLTDDANAQITVSASNFQDGSATVNVDGQDVSSQDFSLTRTTSTVDISGTVEDTSQNGIQSADITVIDTRTEYSTGTSEQTEVTSSDGSFTLSSVTLKDGVEYNIQANEDGYETSNTASSPVTTSDETSGSINAGTATLNQKAVFDVTLDSVPTSVDQGSQLSVTATIKNTGDLEGTQTVQLDFAGSNNLDSQELTLNGGASRQITLSTSSTDTEVAAEDKTVTVSSDDQSPSQAVTVNQVLDSYSVSTTSDPIGQGEALQLEITSAQDKNSDSFTGTADLTIDNIDGQDPSTNGVDFTSGSATGVEVLSTSNTESVSSGDYTSLTVSAQDASDTFGVTVNPVLDTLEVDQDSVEAGQNTALTVDLSNAKDLAGEEFSASSDVTFDISNFEGQSGTKTASSVSFSTGSASGVEVLSSSETQIAAQSEVAVSTDTPGQNGVDSFTANITQVAETISATSNTSADSDEAVADGSDEVKFTATVTDYADNPVEGATVSVDSGQDEGSLSGISAGDSSDTDSNGEATFTATSTNKGDYTVQFSTTSGDASQTPTPTGHFKAGATDYLEITTTPSSSTAGSDSGEFVVTRYDANDNAVTSGSLTVDLSTDSSGQNAEFRDSGSSSLSGTVDITDGSSTASFYYYDEEAGDHSLTANATDITADSVTHTVNSASASQISAGSTTDTATDSNQETGTFTVSASDEYGNSVQGETISIDDADSLGITGDSDTNSTGQILVSYTTETAGTYNPQFSITEGSTDTATVTVEPAVVSDVSITSPSSDQEIASDGTVDFNAEAKDEFGNEITSTDSDFTWSQSSLMTDSGVFNDGGNAEAGTYDVNASYTEGENTVTSDSITVTVGDNTYSLTADQWTALSAPYTTSSVDLQGSDGTILSYDPSAEGDVKYQVVDKSAAFENPQEAYFVTGFDSIAMNEDSDSADTGVTVEEGWNFVGAYNNDASQEIQDVFSPFENAADTIGYPSRNFVAQSDGTNNNKFNGFQNFDGTSDVGTAVEGAYWFHVYDGPATLTPPQPETN